MKYFNIAVFIRGRKKRLCSTLGFSTVFDEGAVRAAVTQTLLYYYFRKDILQIDVTAIEEAGTKEMGKFHKTLTDVC